jgi:hypothetical protein
MLNPDRDGHGIIRAQEKIRNVPSTEGPHDDTQTGYLHALRFHPEPPRDVRPAGMQFKPTDAPSSDIQASQPEP